MIYLTLTSECLLILLTHTSLKIFSVKEAWFFRWHITLTLISHAWWVTATLCSFSSWVLWDLNLKMCFFVGNRVTVNNSWLSKSYQNKCLWNFLTIVISFNAEHLVLLVLRGERIFRQTGLETLTRWVTGTQNVT